MIEEGLDQATMMGSYGKLGAKETKVMSAELEKCGPPGLRWPRGHDEYRRGALLS